MNKEILCLFEKILGLHFIQKCLIWNTYRFSINYKINMFQQICLDARKIIIEKILIEFMLHY